LLDRLAQEVGLAPRRLGQLLEDHSSSAAAPTEASEMPSRSENRSRPGHVRQAIKLTLHKPSAATEVILPEGLGNAGKPGIGLLIALLKTAAEKPDIKAARLTEMHKEHPDGGQYLQALLMQDTPLGDESDWTAQLQATLEAIMYEEREQRIIELTNKANAGLSAAEKQELQALLSGQHSL
jgi:hypothetical protein